MRSCQAGATDRLHRLAAAFAALTALAIVAYLGPNPGAAYGRIVPLDVRTGASGALPAAAACRRLTPRMRAGALGPSTIVPRL
jgi:hypothetical protein